MDSIPTYPATADSIEIWKAADRTVVNTKNGQKSVAVHEKLKTKNKTDYRYENNAKKPGTL